MEADPPEFPVSLPASRPLLIILSGPSGVGKDVTVKRMKERGAPFNFVVTNTTRPKRPGEEEGVDYHFIKPEQFESMVACGEFLEYAQVYKYQYGNSRKEIQEALAEGEDVILRIDTQGAATIRSKVGGTVSIFMVATVSELEERLRQRHTESEEALRLRLETSLTEMREMDKFDYVVVNRSGRLDDTVDDILAIIKAEKRSTHPRLLQFK